jgi:cell division protein FtsW
MVTETKNSSLADGIAMVVVLLMAIGTVFVFSASANLVQELDLRHFYNFPGLRQILFFPLAVAIMYIVSCFNYRRLAVVGSWFKSLPSYLLVFSTALLIIVLFPKIGIEVNNARRWLRIPAGPISISFQPSELAKWSLLIFLAAFCDKYSAELTLYRKRFIPACLIIGLVTALIITQDFGTAAFVSLLSFLILIIAGVKLWHIATLAPFAAVAFAAVLTHSPGRLQRISAFLNPDGHASSAAYQANQSLIALGSGGLLGKGLGEGICKYGHLPEDTTDFVFSIVGEELGLVGTATVILLFIIFVWLGILVVMRCRDRFGQLLAGGIVMAVAIQAALNIGVVTVVLPTKGIPLPFVSAGGTSMLLSSAAVGLLLNIAKQLPKLTPEEKLQ